MGLSEHRAEAGHRHHVDPPGHQLVGDRSGVPVAVECGAEPAVVGPLHQDGGKTGGGRDLECPARPVGDHHADRQTGVDDRLHDGAATGHQHPDAHRSGSGFSSLAGDHQPHATSAVHRRSRGVVRGTAEAGARRVPGASFPSNGTVATGSDRPASGTDPSRAVPPAQGMPLVIRCIGIRLRLPKRKFQEIGAGPQGLRRRPASKACVSRACGPRRPWLRRPRSG